MSLAPYERRDVLQVNLQVGQTVFERGRACQCPRQSRSGGSGACLIAAGFVLVWYADNAACDQVERAACAV